MPDRYRVIFSSEALNNLEAIMEFIARESPQNAAKVVDRLFQAAESLEIFPYRYAVDRRSKGLPFEVRLMPVPPFRVLYSVVESQRVVRIRVVQHGHQR